METEFYENEYWYGGAVHLGIKMPVDAESDITIDLISGEGICDQYSPVFISNKGRYIYSDKPFVITFRKGRITAVGQSPIELCDGHGTLKGAQLALAQKHFDLCGKIPNEIFLKKPQYNTWIEFMYNQNQDGILRYAHTLVDEGMTPGILMIDEGWAPDYGDYDFCKRKFGSPGEMIDELHDLGFKVMLWVTPHISPDSDCYRELRDTDYLIKDQSGKVAVREWWNGFSCVLDLTNPQARKWFRSKLEKLMSEYNVDGFKLDGGDIYMYNESDLTYVKQQACEHTKAFDEFASEFEYNELRRVWNCGGRPLVCRLQDKIPSWEHEYGISSLIPNMLCQGILGYFYGCPDMIGGGAYSYFEQKGFEFDEELYIRWLEASVLCPMMQFSVSPKRVLSENGFKIAEKITALHTRYSDLIIKLARNASVTGEPIMRYMEYEFPGEGFEKVTDQFMLGDRILVAPVTQKGAIYRDVRLPDGRWKYIDGQVFDGGKSTKIRVSEDTLPMFELLIHK